LTGINKQMAPEYKQKIIEACL